jgi:hypothetical protein
MRKLMALWVLALCLPALAQVGSHLREEFQDPEKHGIRIVEKTSEIRGAVHDPKVRILCLQAFGDQLNPDNQKEVLDWVRAGGTVWFYDARLAPHFGMKPYLLEPDQFRNRPEKGVLGGSKRAGLATVGVSYGSHAVQTGVGQVTVFLPEIPAAEGKQKMYGAVEVAGDTLPLLQFTLDSPALMALRREGRGLIVYKTLLWNEPLSGDRFQLNLLDYSAGFQVPGPAGEGKVGNPPGPQAEYITGDPAVPLEAGDPSQYLPPLTGPSSESGTRPNQTTGKPQQAAGGWSLELKDGTTLSGKLELEMLEFETGTQSLKLKPADVVSLEFGSSIKLDKLTTSNGKTHNGLLLSSPLKFRTERGVEEFDKEDLQLLTRGSEEVTSKEK